MNLSLKDEVINSSGRIGQIVSAVHQEGEASNYGVIWNDDPTFIEEVPANKINKYMMPGTQAVEIPFYKFFAGMYVEWS